MLNQNDLTNRTLTITRLLNAPINVVWDAWTQAEQIANWWGPKGMTTKILVHNFEVGGSWKYAMTMPDGNDFIAAGVYSEIIEHKKIVTSADFKPMTVGVELQVILEEAGEKTNFTFHVIHETEAYCQQQEKMGFYNGWGSTFDRLGAYVGS